DLLIGVALGDLVHDRRLARSVTKRLHLLGEIGRREAGKPGHSATARGMAVGTVAIGAVAGEIACRLRVRGRGCRGPTEHGSDTDRRSEGPRSHRRSPPVAK